MINDFRGENSFLSNFHILQNPIYFGNIVFITSEHLYQALKTLIYEERAWIASQPTPREAKWAGSKKGYRGRIITLREDWDQDEVRWNAMFFACMLKYSTNYDLAAKLIATHPKQLIEGNRWHDNYWGDCYCDGCRNKQGLNNLGLVQMQFRKFLISVRI
jgi:ribA/ribD-fused uncharacterized protein